MLVPGKIGFPLIISPTIHPIDHISTGLSYLFEPRTISGALYQRVAIYSVLIYGDVSVPPATDLARPKSATLI